MENIIHCKWPIQTNKHLAPSACTKGFKKKKKKQKTKTKICNTLDQNAYEIKSHQQHAHSVIKKIYSASDTPHI